MTSISEKCGFPSHHQQLRYNLHHPYHPLVHGLLHLFIKQIDLRSSTFLLHLEFRQLIKFDLDLYLIGLLRFHLVTLDPPYFDLFIS